jgi:hypothetical protein
MGKPKTRGRCYDHNFLRFLPIFGEKIGVFLKETNVMIKILQNLALFRVKNANFFANFFGENIFKKGKLKTRFDPKRDLNSENLLPSTIRAMIDFISATKTRLVRS